jgi:hypothetical protein
MNKIVERKLTPTELDKRENILKDLKRNKHSFVNRYGVDTEKVMYGIATKRSKQMENSRLTELIKNALYLREEFNSTGNQSIDTLNSLLTKPLYKGSWGANNNYYVGEFNIYNFNIRQKILKLTLENDFLNKHLAGIDNIDGKIGFHPELFDDFDEEDILEENLIKNSPQDMLYEIGKKAMQLYEALNNGSCSCNESNHDKLKTLNEVYKLFMNINP